MQDSQVTITVTAIDGATKVFEGVGDAAVKNANRAANAWIKANDVSNVSIQSSGQAVSANNRAAKSQDNYTNSIRRSYLAQTALTTVLSASVNQAFMQMVDVTGQAIQRVDLLANFPKSMEALGLSAADASVSLEVLSKYIGEIGGNLQEATTSVARFAEITKNVKAATSIFVGLNNALIAGGAGEAVRASGLEQFTQAFSRGLPQLIEWRSLMVAMPAQLNAVAEAMDFKSAQELGESLTNGETSMKDFVVKLTELSTGTGPIAQQALARMNGIQFAFNVLKNTLVEGMTAIIQTIGRQNIIDFFNLLTGVVRQLTVWAVQLISILISLFNVISRVFGGPQLKLAKDNTSGIADNLGSGASAAQDMADGLGDAGKAAKKVAGSLASFDKMNVLSEKSDGDSGGKDKGSAAGAPLSGGDISGLEDIFGNIDGKIGDISTGAKILAGILASIAGIKFAQGLLNQFNGLAKTMEDTTKNIGKFKDAMKGTDEKKGFFDKAGDAAKGFLSILGTVGGFIAGIFTNPKVAAAAAQFGKFLLGPLVAIGPAIGTVIAAIAALPVAAIVAIAAVVAAVVGLVAWAILDWEGFKTFWMGLWTNIVNFFVGVWANISGFFTAVWAGIMTVVLGFWTWLTTLWAGLTAVLSGPFQIAWQIISSIFILLVALVAITLEAIYNVLKAVAGWIYDNVISPTIDFFVELWNGVVTLATEAWNGLMAILGQVSSWVFDNIILPVGNFFVELWKNIVLGAQAWWNGLMGIMIPIFSWVNANVIQPVLNFFRAMWENIANFARGFVNNVMNFLAPFASWIGNNIVAPIGRFFQSLWDGISNAARAMVEVLKNIFGSIGGFIKSQINAIIDSVNGVIDGLNKIKVPDWVPGLGGKAVNFPKVPRLARGGIVDQPTFAQIGENGAEAVMPLENNTEWIDQLASKINGSSGQPIQLIVKIGEDTISDKIIDVINDQSFMRNSNVISV